MEPPEIDIDQQAMVRGFDAAAHRYEQSAEMQRIVTERLLEQLDLLALKPCRILDAGSGTGYGARLLARRFTEAQVVQLDLSGRMLQEARWQQGDVSHHYICADAARLPFVDGSFDLICSGLMLHWCPKPQEVLAAFARVLRPDGVLLCSFCGPDTLKELRASWAAVDTEVHVHPFLDLHDVGDALVRCGFAQPVLAREDLLMTYPRVLDLLRELRQLGVSNVSRSRHRGLLPTATLKALSAAYECLRHADGRVPATFEIIYAHAFRGTPRSTVPGEASIALHAIRRRPS